MLFPVTATADPTGKILNGCSQLLYLPSASYGTAIPAACTFSTQYINYCTFDISVTGFTGGTQPSGIVFGLEPDRRGRGELPGHPAGRHGHVAVPVRHRDDQHRRGTRVH